MSEQFIGFVEGGKLHVDSPRQFAAYYRRFEGKEVTLTLTERRSKRSLRANAALHGALSLWAAECKHDVEQLKDDLLALRWGYIVRQNVFTGEVIKELAKPHTSDLTTQEFSELMELAAVEAAKEGHVMLMPDEWKQAKRQAERAQKAKAA